MMDSGEKVIVCDKCKHEFLIGSVGIKECSVEIGGKKLLLDYFMCPECKKIYKVLFVDGDEYRALVDDLLATEKRIRKLHGKGNEQLLDRLQGMALRKKERIQNYVKKMNAQYPGTFTWLASENNQQDGTITYRP